MRVTKIYCDMCRVEIANSAGKTQIIFLGEELLNKDDCCDDCRKAIKERLAMYISEITAELKNKKRFKLKK